MTRTLSTIVAFLLLVSAGGAQWHTFSPPGSVDGRGILADVLSRCDAQGRRNAYEPDRVTYCHELTHQLNSRIRNSTRGNRLNALYVGEGRAMILSEPNIRLQTVAQYVDPKYRNSTYQLYFVSMRQYWDNQPLYVLDEWTAYCNGAQAARELRCDEHGSNDRAMWFCHYADCLVAAVKEHDPKYAQLAELTAFVDWQKKRSAELAKR